MTAGSSGRFSNSGHGENRHLHLFRSGSTGTIVIVLMLRFKRHVFARDFLVGLVLVSRQQKTNLLRQFFVLRMLCLVHDIPLLGLTQSLLACWSLLRLQHHWSCQGCPIYCMRYVPI